MSFSNPCVKDCPDRCGGCSISCPRWAEYVAARDAEYDRRRKEAVQRGAWYSVAQEQRHRKFLKRNSRWKGYER